MTRFLISNISRQQHRLAWDIFRFQQTLSLSRQTSSHCIPTHSVGQGLVLPSSDLRNSFPIVPRGGSTIQKHWNVEFARQQVAEFLRTGYTFFHCYTPDRNEGAHIHRPKAWVLPCNSVNKTTKCGYCHGFRRPSKIVSNSTPSKIMSNSTRLWKLLKIAEFRIPTSQDVREKKGIKILKTTAGSQLFLH